MSKTERLELLRNRLTGYEITASNGDRKILIAYSGAKSRHGLLRACQARGEKIIKALEISDDAMFLPAARAADGFKIGDWAFRFSGRTERDAIMEGELPYVGDLV